MHVASYMPVLYTRLLACRKRLGGGGMLNSSAVLSSLEQHEIDSALISLLPKLPPADGKEAFPAAALDMHSVAQQLDSQIAPAGKSAHYLLHHECFIIC